MRIAVVIALLAGCASDRASEVCERARAHALANQQVYLAEVMAETPENGRAALRAQAKEEDDRMRERFVGVCKADRDFKPECFASTDAERSAACRPFIKAFVRKIYR